jgi:hypothetical protein
MQQVGEHEPRGARAYDADLCASLHEIFAAALPSS